MRLPFRVMPRPKRRTKAMRRNAPAGRGVALLFVLTTVAILSVVATDFVTGSRVNLELAVQSRDALRARSLAMSAMTYSRLILRFQRQLDLASGAIGQGLANTLPGAAGMPPELAGMLGGGGLSIRLWDVIPVDSAAITGFIGSAFPDPDSDQGRRIADRYERAKGDHGLEEQGAPIQADFGQFTGTFGAVIEDEDQKINVQKLAYALGPGQLATAASLRALVLDPKYDFLFDREDANGDRISRDDLLLNIKDYIDQDEVSSVLDLSGQNAMSPFANGFGDENGPYSRYRRRYKAKNEAFDTTAELHMVAGVNDMLMAAIGDRLTVYPNPNDRINVNTNDPRQVLINIILAARNKNDPALQDPVRLQEIMQQLSLLRMFPFIGITVQQFAAVLQANGIEVDPAVLQNTAQNQALGDRSTTFRITATGQVGRVKKTLTAVVAYDEGLGKVLYWNER